MAAALYYWYLEVIDVRHGGHKTGQGAAWPTEAETRARFEAVRPEAVPGGGFLLDLHNPKGDLIDTIEIDAAVFEQLLGEPPADSYAEYDRTYWHAAQVARWREGYGGGFHTKMASPSDPAPR